MADTKITQLPAIATRNSANLIEVVQSPFGATDSVKATVAQAVADGLLFGGPYSNRHLGTSAPATRANNASNAGKAVHALVLARGPVTGIRYRKGTGTSGANIRTALYDADGAQIAVSASQAQGTSASVTISAPFTGGPFTIEPGVFWLYWMGSSTSADFMGWAATNDYLGPMFAATEGSFAPPASITPPALNSLNTAQLVPFLTLY